MPVFPGSTFEMPDKLLGKIAQMVKTAVNGNLCNWVIRVSQKISAHLQAVDIHKNQRETAGGTAWISGSICCGIHPRKLRCHQVLFFLKNAGECKIPYLSEAGYPKLWYLPFPAGLFQKERTHSATADSAVRQFPNHNRFPRPLSFHWFDPDISESGKIPCGKHPDTDNPNCRVIQHRCYIIFRYRGFVCGQKRGMEKNTDKGAVMLTDGISVMQLPGIYHNPRRFPSEAHCAPLNIVIHFPLFRIRMKLHILMPVTQSLFSPG